MQEPEISDQYASPGERLTHLLDNVMFESGRGRTRALYNLLIESSIEDFSDLKFGTVRSWFHNHAPTMRKVSTIVELLSATYVFEQDKEQIAVWWKVGGYYPFSSVSDSLDLQKLDFVITSLITDEVSESLQEIDASKLLAIKSMALDMCKAFSDPAISDCPVEYIKTFIRGSLKDNSKK